MKKINLKSNLKVFLLVSLIGFIFIRLAVAEELVEQAKGASVVQEFKESTRIVITTSGPAKFTSYWLDNPARLVVEFQTKNVVSKIGSELFVNEGVIKRITSEYYGGGQNKTLKSLTFELLEKAPYKIWQEENNIILDIQASLGQPMLSNKEKEVFVKNESGEQIVKRLEAMGAALTKVSVIHQPSEAPVVIAELPNARRRNTMSIALWFIGLVLISGLGLLLFWLFWRRYRLILDKNRAAQEITKLKSELQEKNKLLEQEEIIRKTVENTSIQREKEFDQFKLELQKEKQLLEQEEAIRKEKEKTLLELEKQHEQLKETSESLKDVLVKRGIARELTLPESKGELWILGKSPERRNLPRLALTKDFHNTVILKIELPNTLKQIKSFAENISSGGLCFETKSELDEKNPLNLRLFFYGGKVPNFRTQGWIVWRRTYDSKSYYGIVFEGLSEKVKSELQHYIESNLPSHQLSV